MDHRQYKEQTELLFYEELEGREREEAEAHMQSCEECRSIFDELKKLHGVLAQYRHVEATDRLLSEARAGLRSALSGERSSQSWRERLSEWIDGTLGPQVKLAFGGVATIALGILLGYVAFKSPASHSDRTAQPAVQPVAGEERPLLPEGGQIANVKFIDSDTRGGDVDFT